MISKSDCLGKEKAGKAWCKDEDCLYGDTGFRGGASFGADKGRA